ncbi:MAG: glycosyltransferase family 4 protein [Deltaproteobacteria bacterium]|nr:glycosyltransferase family 4 protein [Deltaproteobacteria bacterium]
MRLGLVIYGSLDTASGGYLYDRQLAHWLTTWGQEVRVLSQPPGGYAANLAANFGGRRLAARARACQILLEDELNHPSLLVANRLLARQGPRLVGVVHHLKSDEPSRGPARRWALRLVERQFLHRLHALVCNSRHTRERVTRVLGRRLPAVVAWPGKDHLGPPLSREAVVGRALAPGPLRLVMVGSLIPRKGLHRLLPALTRLGSLPFSLEVVGDLTPDPAYTRRVRRLLLGAGLADRVRLRGRLSDAALREILARSHALCMPFGFEGFGIVHLEALAHGLPVLAAREGGAAEIIRPGREGRLFAPGETGRVAAYLRELAGDRDLLAARSLAARDRFDQMPTWEASAARVRDFLQELAAKGAGEGGRGRA